MVEIRFEHRPVVRVKHESEGFLAPRMGGL